MKKLRYLLALLTIMAVVATACGGRDDDGGGDAATDDTTEDDSGSDDGGGEGGPDCEGEPLEATEVGVSEDTITIETLADVGSPLAPGLFQGNHDALEAYAEYINANGGIACRQLEVKLWDSKLNPDETKNGLIEACSTALAMVGSNSLFNPDTAPLKDCDDKAGEATGLPDIAALANDINQMCNPTTFLIQGASEQCEVLQGERTLNAFVGTVQYYQEVAGEDLNGIFFVPGDLPTTVQSATYQIKAQEDQGVTWDATLKVGGRDEQAAYTPRIQQLKAAESNYAYMGSNDRAMVSLRKEAKAQGVDSVKVWACSLACYTRNFLATGGADVEDTYVWMQFLPFEEAESNEAMATYIEAVGGMSEVDSFGAQAWQAAMLFKEVIDEIVETDGVNGITRARMLEVLQNKDDFTADGWMGDAGKDLRGFSNCMIIMQVEGGEFVRRFPEEPGTLDCKDEYLTEVTLDPAKEAESIK